MSDSEAVLTERRENVLLITIDRPEVRNAVNGAVAEGIAGALDELDGDDGAFGRHPDRRRRLLLRRAWISARSSKANRPGSATAASPGSPSAPRASR